jgi:hypothetical protein
MYRLTLLCSVIIPIATTASATCFPSRMHDDFLWCMETGKGDIQGRNTMWDGMKANEAMTIMHGFSACTNAPHNPDRQSGGNNGWECYNTGQVDPIKLAHQVTHAFKVRARQKTRD